MAKTKEVEAKFPPVFRFLFFPSHARYRVAYGGRGSGKSWSFARALICKAAQGKTRILCAREIQNSIKQSVHQLLVDQIDLLQLTDAFTVTERSIECKVTGSEFLFCGLFRNVNQIKSLEGIDICWVEEAEAVSDDSWDILLPTIRKENSEIWISFNTKYADDPTYKRFVTNPPPDCIVQKINYEQNPYFNATLEAERKTCQAYQPQEYKNIWLGEPIGFGRKVWQEFSDTLHVKDFGLDKVKDVANCYMAMDPAQHYYPACVWIAMFPKNNRRDSFYKWVYAEWPMHEDLGSYFSDVRTKLLYTGTLADMAKAIYIKDGTAEHGIKILKRGIDTRFAKGSGSSSFFSSQTVGIVGEFAKKDNGGLIFDCPSEKIIDVQRDNIVKDLRYNTLVPLGPYNEPNLYVAPWCRNLIQTLNNHRLEEDSEAESAKYKDFSDALRICYATMDGARWKDLTPEPIQQYSDNTMQFSNSDTGWMG